MHIYISHWNFNLNVFVSETEYFFHVFNSWFTRVTFLGKLVLCEREGGKGRRERKEEKEGGKKEDRDEIY